MNRAASCSIAFLTFLSLPLPALARDVATAEKAVKWARMQMESRQFDGCRTKLAEAEAALGVDEASAAAVRESMAALTKECFEIERTMFAETLVDELDRGLEGAQYELDRGMEGDGNAEVAEAMESSLARMEAMTDRDDAKKWLSEEVRADYKRKAAELRARGVQAGRDVRYRRAEGWLVRVEAMNAGTSKENVYRDTVDQWMEYAGAEIEKLSEDSRHGALTARLEKARAGFASLTANADRDEFVNGVVAKWQGMLQNDNGASAGWENEPETTYERFVQQGGLESPKTAARCRLVQYMVDDQDYQRARKDFADDARIIALVAEIDREMEGAAARICAMTNSILERAEKEQPPAGSEGERWVSTFERLGPEVDRLGRDSKQREATKARADGLIARVASDKAAKVAAYGAMEKKCTAAAESSWPSIVESCGEAGRIDPVECVEDLGSWKGKTVRLADVRNRAGWDFQSADYDLIVPMNGVPVAGQFDPALWKAIEKMANATGLKFDRMAIDDVVGVVDGACRVQGIEYSQLLKEHLPTVNYKAPLLRIVAVKAGPFAVSVERSNIDGLDDLGDAVGLASGSSESESGSSGFPFFKLLVLAALVAGYVKYRRQVNAFALAVNAKFNTPKNRAAANEMVRGAVGHAKGLMAKRRGGD